MDHTLVLVDEKTVVRDVPVAPTVVKLGQRIEAASSLTTDDVDARIDIFNYKFTPEMYGAFGDASVAGATYGQTGHDDSAAIQDAIDNASANAVAGGKTAIVEFQSRGYFCNVILKPGVILKGSGFGTKLLANPGSVTPVLGSVKEAVIGPNEPIRVQVHDLCVDGNYAGGGGIEIVSSNNDTFTSAHPTTSPGIWNVNDPAPVLNNLIVQRCTGIGISLGRNMRNSQVSNIFVFQCKNNGMHVSCTDGEFSSLQVGVCAQGIFVDGPSNKFSNSKAWYSGATVGAATCSFGIFGNGWEIATNSTYLIGCESQDNDTYGLAIHNGDGIMVSAFTASSDATGSLYLRSVRGATIDVMMVAGDRGTTGFGITIDFGNVYDNRIKFRDYWANGRSAGYKIVRTLNGGSMGRNMWDLPGDNQTFPMNFLAAITPGFEWGKTQQMTLTGNTTVNAAPADGVVAPGQEVSFTFTQDAVGGRTVTWDASWGTPPAIDPAPNATTVYRFKNTSYTTQPTWKFAGSSSDTANLDALQRSFHIYGGRVQGTIVNATGVQRQVLAGNTNLAENAANAFLAAQRIDTADFVAPKGKTAKLRLRAWIANNGTDPLATITIELRAVTGVVNVSANNGPAVTTGAPIASVALTPAGGASLRAGVSAEVNFDAATLPTGNYVITATASAAAAANSAVSIVAEMQVHAV